MKAKAVFDIFAEINKVPRPSKHEEKICEWLIQFAKEHQLEYEYMPIAENTSPQGRAKNRRVDIIVLSSGK